MKKRTLPLLLLAGKSGSGKDTVAHIICKDLGVSQVASYTTRPMRPGEVNGVGHVFISDAEYDRIPEQAIVASTVFSGHRYCATVAQLDDAGVYIVDRKGIEDVRDHYHAPLLVVLLDTTDAVRRERMAKRGDSKASIEERIANDRVMFAGIEEDCDIIISAEDSPEHIARDIESMLMRATRIIA